MSAPLLVEMYELIPELKPGDDEELWAAGVHEAMREFRAGVRGRYTEGTLSRLLHTQDVKTRRAAVLALGLLGTMESNATLAAALRDVDELVRRFATDGLWELWFRGGTAEQNRLLQQAAQKLDQSQTRASLDSLIQQAPHFSEAYNQRAIWYFQRSEFARAAEDCETTLRLNPFHFAAAAGLGQCYLKLGKPRAALRVFRSSIEINPDLEHLRDTIRSLEETLNSRGE